jgi:hypothetical protein
MTRARDVATQGGLVLLNTTTFSAQSAVSINNVFSATYDNYKCTIFTTASAGSATLSLRLRASGADNSTGNYYTASAGLTTAGAAANLNSTSATSFNIGATESGYASYAASFDVVSPFLTSDKYLLGNQFEYNGTTTVGRALNGLFDTTTYSATGLTLLSTQNITGTIEVYGYK